MAHPGGQESNPKEKKVSDHNDENEDCKEEIALEQKEGEDKSVPPSASFNSEVQLAGEFGQLEGMSALLGKKKELIVRKCLISYLLQSHSTVMQWKIKIMVWEVLSKACLLFPLS